MKNYFLGIEYSKERVKCALLSFDGKDYEIASLQSFENDNINSSLDALISWKKDLLADKVIKAVISLSESSIFLKELRVPSAKKESLDEAIYWELASNSPLPPNQAIYEWSEIDRTATEVNIVAMAVRENMVSALSDKLESNGIEVVAVEPSSISLSRIAGGDFQKNTMLLMVGSKETDIVVLKNGKPVFSTTSDVALKRDKEKWKLSKTVSEKIAQNTDDLITFWEERNDSKIQQVLITGDLVDKYFGLAAKINEFAKIPVNIAKQKNIHGIHFASLPKAIVNRFFVSIGAVVRFGEDLYGNVNLIPKEKRVKIAQELAEKAKLQRLSFINNLLILFTLGLLVAGVFFLTLKLSYNIGIKKFTALVNEHPAQEIRQDVAETNKYLSQIESISNSRKDEGQNLKKLASATPLEVKLTSLSFTDDKERVWVLLGEGSREAVLAYFANLEANLDARSVTMPYSNINEDGLNKFEIDLIW